MPAPSSLLVRLFAYIFHAGLWCGVGVLGALYLTGQLGGLANMLPIGEPEEDDDRVRWTDAFFARQGPPRTIYLHRGPITLSAGIDAAHQNRSSVVFSSGLEEVKLPGFTGANKAWQDIVACVKKQFAPFAVDVTEERPLAEGYAMVVVGGRPNDVGVPKKNVTGLAPFNGSVIPDPVVFAFSTSLQNRVRAVCEVITMEVAHAYGLDHGYHCPDVMSYLHNCGNKSFVDKDVPCGEYKARPCAGGQVQQNSYKSLIATLGPRGKPNVTWLQKPTQPTVPAGHAH